MRRQYLNIIIAGHVDHGKSTLIGRLLLDTDSLPEGKLGQIKRVSKDLGKDTELAYLVDQLKEERERNMTIDTTQTFFKTRKRNYVIIDSPGHAQFIKNMLTGASLAQAAILIVDAQEGIMEQTRRHAYLIDMLGIKNIIVALNKMDLLHYSKDRFEALRNELAGFLGSLNIKPEYFIPISAREGDNIAFNSRKARWYKGKNLIAALDSIEQPKVKSNRPLRLPIQDVYDIDGKKIVVGDIVSGEIKNGQPVLLSPSLKPTMVNDIRMFGERINRAGEGSSVGLILSDPQFAQRGEVITQRDEAPHASRRFRSTVFWMAQRPLEINTPLTIKCATQEAECIAEKIEKRINSSSLEIIEENARALRLNESGIVIFNTKNPMIIEKFDFIEDLGRFIIEVGANLQGAGIILEKL